MEPFIPYQAGDPKDGGKFKFSDFQSSTEPEERHSSSTGGGKFYTSMGNPQVSFGKPQSSKYLHKAIDGTHDVEDCWCMQSSKSELNDLKPFKHGQEGTHCACAVKANSDGPTTCCICYPHEGCEL